MCVFPSHRCFSGLRAGPRPAATRVTLEEAACASLAAPRRASLPAPLTPPWSGLCRHRRRAALGQAAAEPKPACRPLRPGPGTSAPQRELRPANHSPDTAEARLMGVTGSQMSSRESTCLPRVWKLPALKLRTWRAAR